jgi:hypothetical protein
VVEIDRISRLAVGSVLPARNRGAEALKLQRPLPDGVLEIVARGEKKDEAPIEA